MSTNVNITVDKTDLVTAAKLLQKAAREALARKEADKKLEDEAAKALEKKKEVLGSEIEKPRPDKPPAADRRVFRYGQAYFSAFAVDSIGATHINIRSGNKNVTLEEILPGTGQPVGYRDRSGADALPILEAPAGADTSENQPYYWIKVEEFDVVEAPNGDLLSYKILTTVNKHMGVRKFANGNTGYIDAINTSSGGWAQFSSDVTSNLIVLPVNQNIAVFAYTEARHSYKTYSLAQESKLETVTRNESGTFDTVVTHTVTSEVMATEDEQMEIKVAYLVGKNFIKKINYPGILYDKIALSRLYTKINLIQEGTSAPYPLVTGFGTVSGVWFSEDMEEVPPNLNETQQLMSKWGEARYEGTNYGEHYSFSPGVYSAIKHNSGQDPPFTITPIAPPVSYNSIKNQLPAIGQKFRWFRVKEEQGVQKLQRYSAVLPAVYGDNFNENLFRTIRNINYSYASTNDYYRWNDWGRSSYCRAELASLGFPAADLRQ